MRDRKMHVAKNAGRIGKVRVLHLKCIKCVKGHMQLK